MIISGTTEHGFDFSYDKRILDDFRFVRAISETQSNDEVKKLNATVKMVEMLLGPEGLEKLQAFIMASNDGFCPSKALMDEVKAILNSSKDLKN